MLGNRTLDLPHQSGASDPHQAARLHEPGEGVEIQIIRAVIHKRVNAHDGVEELGGEWQGPCARVDRENPVLYAGIAAPLEVLADAEPQVSGPYLDADLTVEKDRGPRAPAAAAQHAHAGP